MEIGLIASMLGGSTLVPSPSDGPMSILTRSVIQMVMPAYFVSSSQKHEVMEMQLEAIEVAPEN